MRIKMTADVLNMMHGRRQWCNIFKVLKEKPDKLDFYTQQKYISKIKKGKIKLSFRYTKDENCISSIASLENILKEVFQAERQKWQMEI